MLISLDVWWKPKIKQEHVYLYVTLTLNITSTAAKPFCLIQVKRILFLLTELKEQNPVLQEQANFNCTFNWRYILYASGRRLLE